MPDGRQQELDERGLIVVPDALPCDLLGELTRAVDRIYEREREAGSLAADESLHLLGAVAQDEIFLELLDLPATFPMVCGALGWNIHMYHSHLDVHPPSTGRQGPSRGAGIRTAAGRTSSWRPTRDRGFPSRWRSSSATSLNRVGAT